ncbi:unnamed protein product [Calicophoron daubneyi]|uniref:dual-specificity kinase n=1 Tax=Calicophoron daubneyi TaxID=300641 RepID=A0AAV2TFH6_CALDB
MEMTDIINDKYYSSFVPTNSAKAIHKAGSHLYCFEDIIVKGKLGNGYFASVFLVQHLPTSQLMAMKLTNEVSVQRREIELLSSLNHENVLKLYGSCVIGARFACLTEFANGGSLAGLISAKTVELPWFVRVNLAMDIARGLSHLHLHDLIHRDLSSANILIRITPQPTSSSCTSNIQSSTQHLQLPYGLSASHGLSVYAVQTLQNCIKSNSQLSEQQENMVSSPDSDTITAAGHGNQHPTCHSSLSNHSVDHEKMGDIDMNLSDMDTLLDPLNGDSAKRDGPIIHSNRFLSLPFIEPVWKHAGWLGAYANSGTEPCYTAIVADLGLCLDLSQKHADTTSLAGNPYYIAPECLNRIAPYTFAADVFAVGILMCELITRLVNDGIRIPRTPEFGVDQSKLPVPFSCPPWFLQSALDCCTVDYLKRPTLSTVISTLTDQLASAERNFASLPRSATTSLPLVEVGTSSSSFLTNSSDGASTEATSFA